jgi:hypothetical protein
MSYTILIAIGTTPCAIGIEFLKLQQAERLSVQLSTDHSAIERHQSHERTQVILIDVDATQVYPNHASLHPLSLEWQTENFLHCQTPGADLIQGIKSGRYRGRFENFNSQAIQALEASAHAAGGTPPNGYIAFEINRNAIERKIRNCFKTTLLQRPTISSSKEERVRVMIVASVLGGFASGSLESLKELIGTIAQDTQVNVQVACTLMIPGGANTGKDRTNSLAITAATLKKLMAISTGLYSHRQRQPGYEHLQSVLTRHVPTFVVSDVNHAEVPQGLAIADQIGMIAHWLRAVLTTPLGARRDSQAADFVVKARELTATGEPKTGLSFGFSMIVLGRDRLQQYAVPKLMQASLGHLLTPISSELVYQQAQDFIYRQRLLSGAGELQLLNRLLDEPIESGNPVTTERLFALFDAYAQQLHGMDVLFHGKTQIWIAVEQAVQPDGEFDAVLKERQQQICADFNTELSRSLVEFLKTNGIAASRQFLTQLRETLETTITETARELRQFELELAQHQEVINQYQTEVIPYLQKLQQQQRSWLDSTFNGKKHRAKVAAEIRNHGQQYLTCLRQFLQVWMQNRAEIVALETVERLLIPVQRLLEQIHHIEVSAISLQRQCQQEMQTVADYEPRFECPNGLYLIRTPKDLQDYYHKLLPDENEESAIAEITRNLLQLPEVLTQLMQFELIQDQLMNLVKEFLHPQLIRLHVVTELRDRFSDDRALGSVLRQRDRESYEFIQFQDSCDTEHGTSLLRFLGIDQSQARNLPELLRQYGYQRGTEYEVVNTGDSERILFLQERAVFPLTAWAHYPLALDAYRLVSQQTPFEKLHARVGDRYLITPGRYLDVTEAGAVVMRAWLLDRIHYNPQTASYQLESPGNLPLSLTRVVPVLCSSAGYRYSVEIISQFSNLLLKQGSASLFERLNHLMAMRDGQRSINEEVEKRVVQFLDDEVYTLLREQLEWWYQNSVPESMEWFS